MSRNKVRKLPEPERAKTKPKEITTPGKPGDSGPGGAHPGRNRPKQDTGASVQDEVRHTTFINQSGNRENKTG